MDKIQIADIKIGERRREDLGDIEALARSIEKYGLLAPPVLTDDGTLVAGQRRVEAMKRLGWTETPFINKGELTQAQLHEIELEENIRRKDFTEYEISKNMVALAEAVGERLLEQSRLSLQTENRIRVVDDNEPTELMQTVCINSRRGPREKPNSSKAIANEIGVSRPTIDNARAHVAAVETYPVLESLPKMKAISIAKQADKLPEEERVPFAQGRVIELRANTHKTETNETASSPEPVSESAADTRAYNLTKAYNNTICAVMQLDSSSDAVREWIRFSRMTRDEIQGALTDISVAIEHLQKLGETLSGCLGPQRLK